MPSKQESKPSPNQFNGKGVSPSKTGKLKPDTDAKNRKDATKND